jgi:hypothetical protein
MVQQRIKAGDCCVGLRSARSVMSGTREPHSDIVQIVIGRSVARSFYLVGRSLICGACPHPRQRSLNLGTQGLQNRVAACIGTPEPHTGNLPLFLFRLCFRYGRHARYVVSDFIAIDAQLCSGENSVSSASEWMTEGRAQPLWLSASGRIRQTPLSGRSDCSDTDQPAVNPDPKWHELILSVSISVPR